MRSGLVLPCGDDIKLIGYCWIYLLHLDPQAPGVKERKRAPRLSILGMQQYTTAQHGMKQKRHCPCPVNHSVSRDR